MNSKQYTILEPVSDRASTTQVVEYMERSRLYTSIKHQISESEYSLYKSIIFSMNSKEFRNLVRSTDRVKFVTKKLRYLNGGPLLDKKVVPVRSPIAKAISVIFPSKSLEFKSIIAASEYLGCSHSTLSRKLKSNKSFRDCIVKYRES